MKVLYQYRPLNTADTSLTISGSDANVSFPLSNLYNIRPTRSFKTLNATGDKFVKFDSGLGQKITVDSLFINRFNFADFRIQGSDDDFATTPFDLSITGCTLDELYEPNASEITSDRYMHRWVDLVSFSYRYLRVFIPAQTPLFETSCIKVGNILFGNSVEIWNPKPGFKVTPVPNIVSNDFPSGYQTIYKEGKTFRMFEGTLDKILTADYLKLVQAYNPIVLYLDWEANPQSAYLVRATKEYSRSYEMSNVINFDFSFRELV